MVVYCRSRLCDQALLSLRRLLQNASMLLIVVCICLSERGRQYIALTVYIAVGKFWKLPAWTKGRSLVLSQTGKQ